HAFAALRRLGAHCKPLPGRESLPPTPSRISRTGLRITPGRTGGEEAVNLVLPALLTAALLGADDAGKYFAITVVDEATGRGVPRAELRTSHGVRLWTDSNGVAAFHEPGLMGKDVFFHVSSHGYEFAKDGFGFRGKSLRVTEGGSAKLTIKRVNIAERL